MIDRQHQHPQGLIGRLIGERMARQHWPETQWTIEQLNLLPQDRILELGFGVGRALEMALHTSTGGQVVGVEISKTMIYSTGMKLRRSPFQHKALLLRANFHHLPLKTGAFEKIFSIHTFYFWQEPEMILRDLYRLLSPRGKMVLTMATAKRDAHGHWVYWPLQAVLEQETLPVLHEIGFRSARLEHGPDSRAYNNVALVAEK